MSYKKHRRQFNKIRKIIHVQSEKFSKKLKTIKKNQTEVLELKNLMIKMKNETERICSRVDQMEDKISNQEDSNFEITQSEVNREKRMKKKEESVHDLWDSIKLTNI